MNDFARRSRSILGIFLLAGLAPCAWADEISMSPDALVADAVEVRDVEVSRFGNFVAIYDLTEGNAIRLFDRDLNQLWRKHLPYFWSGSLDEGSVLQFAPDESFVLFPGGRTENDICVCDPVSGEAFSILHAHENAPGVLALSPDGQWLFSASHDEIVLWRRNAETFEPVQITREYTPYVHSAEFLTKNLLVVNTTQQMVRTITVYDVVQGEFTDVFTYSLRDSNISNDMDQIAIAPDGQRFATGYRDRVFIFRVTGSDVELEHTITDIDVGNVTSLVFSPGGEYLVTGHSRFVKWWSAANGWQELTTVATQQPAAYDLEMSADGGLLFLGSRAEENALTRFTVEGAQPSPLGVIIRTLGGALSEAQRRVLTPELAASIVDDLGPDAVAPRDMFETADEYRNRMEAAARSMNDRILDAVEGRYQVRRLDEGTVRNVGIPLQEQGTYDIDRNRYAIRFMDTDGWLMIDRGPARELYQAWSDAMVVATRFSRDGATEYADFRLLHPDGSTFPVVLEQNPFTGERLNPARSLLPAAPIGPDVLVRDLAVDGIFPALYAQYAERPIGTFIVENIGTGIVSDLRARFTIAGLTGEEQVVELPQSLAAGSSATAELVSPVSADVLKSTDGGTATLSLTVTYRRGEVHSTEITRQIRILNRNAIQWSDDRRLGAFMTVSNPVVLAWGADTASSASQTPTPVLTRNFIYAMYLYQSLSEAGLQYVVDPNSAYASLSVDSVAVDFLRFPAETLTQGAGDCDDLSVLYATLLESVGVPSAYITTPGHIFVAFDTGIPDDLARTLFDRPENLILRDGHAWMPVETTILDQGFTKAWQTGALQWRQADEAGTAGFFTAQDAWREYTPVTPSLSIAPPQPPLSVLQSSVSRELDSFREIELYPKLRELGEDSSPALLNQRGVLYASYGLLDEAAVEFERALAGGEYVPALINQANVLSVIGRPEDAREYLERARSVAPDNPRVLLGLAFSYWENGEHEEARDTYAEATRSSPSLARRFPLFTEDTTTARAGSADSPFNLDWVTD